LNDNPEMPQHATPIDLTLPAIDIRLALPLDDGTGRVISFNTVVPQHADDEQINELLDKLSRAGERQKALVEIPTLQAMLDEKKAALITETEKAFKFRQESDEQQASWQREAQASQRRNWKPTPAQSGEHARTQAEIAKADQNVRVLEKQIASETNRIAIYRGRLGVGA
jgi:hypothetical protein